MLLWATRARPATMFKSHDTTLAFLRSNPFRGHSFQEFDEDDENPMTLSDDSDIESLCETANTPKFDFKRPATYFL